MNSCVRRSEEKFTFCTQCFKMCPYVRNNDWKFLNKVQFETECSMRTFYSMNLFLLTIHSLLPVSLILFPLLKMTQILPSRTHVKFSQP